jgi:hypothetical protein
LAELPGSDSFGVRLLVVGHLRNELDRAQDAARRAVPDLPAERTPIAKAVDNGDGPRTIELCDLWRSRLTGDGRNTDELRRFFAAEQELRQHWEEQHAEAGAAHLRRVVRLGGMLRTALDALHAAHRSAEPHPALGPVLTAVGQDVQKLAASTEERVRAARRQLAGSASPPVVEQVAP